MALTQAMCTSFKQELLVATHNFTNGQHAFKLALFDQNSGIAGTFGAGTTNYSNMSGDEGSGTGYTAGGAALTNVTPTTSGTTAYCDFADLTFSAVTITSRGCLIYNTSASNKAVAVYDFGSDKTATAGDFTVVFPTADASNAVIRLT